MKDIFEHDVIKIFKQLSRIPRESGNEKAVSDWIKAWAEERGLSVRQDEIWDLIIKKPASKGFEDHPPVLMQAHIDMVCEKNRHSDHDFTKDPIELVLEDGWIKAANGTTLGADNGVGAAAALAILDDETLQHPPLEVVFTVQEETTFAGAENVDISDCQAMRMINLDHADERELIVGSCGGTGVEFTMPLERDKEFKKAATCSNGAGSTAACVADSTAACTADYKPFHIRLSGLKGGHSGEDIHRGRGNAISLLLRLLESPDLRVVSITGGTNRLAIPREAEAVVLADEKLLHEHVAEAKATFRKEYSGAAPDLDISVDKLDEPNEPNGLDGLEEPNGPNGLPAGEGADCLLPLTEASFKKIAAVWRLYPNGIVAMNGNLEGLVESSDNIGIISTEGDVLTLTSEVRGAYQSTVDDIVKTIEALAELVGGKTSYFSAYVPWEFAADSKLRPLAVDTYRQLYGGEMKQLALHAGLECGFFAEKKPGMDIISIGPDCQSFHSPEERVRVESIEHFYEVLKTILAKL